MVDGDDNDQNKIEECGRSYWKRRVESKKIVKKKSERCQNQKGNS